MPWRSRTRSGEIKHALQSGYLIELGGGQHHVAIIRDMTDAIAGDIALRQSEERLQQAVRVAHIGMFDHDHQTGSLRRDGQVRWITTRARTSFAGEGAGRHPVRTVGAAADVTERKQVEHVLRIAAAAFESNEGRIITDANGRILQMNRAFQELTGFSAQEAIDRTPSLEAVERLDG